MLNRYPLWKYLLILVVLVVGLIYSLPNLFPADPAIQVSDAQGDALDERQITRVEEALSERDIAVKAVEDSGSNEGGLPTAFVEHLPKYLVDFLVLL